MNDAVVGKDMENVRKQRDITLVTTERRRIYLVPETNYHTIKFITENLLAIDMKITQIHMDKPVYLGLSIIELSKILMYEFWYDYVKPKCSEKPKLNYMDTDMVSLHTKKTNDIYKDIAEDIETRFDTSNFELDKLMPKGKNKKLIA